jgi:CBS domain-containing protein
MKTRAQTYADIRQEKESTMEQYLYSTQRLNAFHDDIMKQVFLTAFQNHKEANGAPPCLFTLFLLGSAGRFEQGTISDQDHGMIYEFDTDEAAAYFLTLGQTFSDGLNAAGYPYCEGKVMSSNPVWCRSIEGWKTQIDSWIKAETLDTIRSLHMVCDARTLYGEKMYIASLKKQITAAMKKDRHVLKRFFENIQYMKKSVGLFGQIFTEQNGHHTGALNLKQSAFLPYVNAIRVLAVKEGIEPSSTIMRMKALKQIPAHASRMNEYEEAFRMLLDFRLRALKNAPDYDSSHYITIHMLGPVRKKELRHILKTAEALHHYVQRFVEKG